MSQVLSVLCLLSTGFAAQAFAADPPSDRPATRDSATEYSPPILSKIPYSHLQLKNARQDKAGSLTPADADQEAVRKHSEKYAASLLRGDKAALEALLHKDYHAHTLAGAADFANGDKAQAVAYWTWHRFRRMKVETRSIKLFGDTTIESGALSAEWYASNPKQSNTWGELPYTRVWVRQGKTWQLVHEPS